MITLLPMKALTEATRLSRATIYVRINGGLFPKPVRVGERLSAWPSNEVEAVNRAVIAGAKEPELRALVADLERQRTATAA